MELFSNFTDFLMQFGTSEVLLLGFVIGISIAGIIIVIDIIKNFLIH